MQHATHLTFKNQNMPISYRDHDDDDDSDGYPSVKFRDLKSKQLNKILFVYTILHCNLKKTYFIFVVISMNSFFICFFFMANQNLILRREKNARRKLTNHIQ